MIGSRRQAERCQIRFVVVTFGLEDLTTEFRGERRFPPPWSIEEQVGFVLRDAGGQALA